MLNPGAFAYDRCNAMSLSAVQRQLTALGLAPGERTFLQSCLHYKAEALSRAWLDRHREQALSYVNHALLQSSNLLPELRAMAERLQHANGGAL